MPCLNVYIESHACYEELFKTYLLLCMYQTCILAFAFALNCILNMLQVDDDDAMKRSSVDA